MMLFEKWDVLNNCLGFVKERIQCLMTVSAHLNARECAESSCYIKHGVSYRHGSAHSTLQATSTAGTQDEVEFRKKLMEIHKVQLPPTCKKLFRVCSPKLFALMPLLSRLEKQWDAFQAVPCVQTAFDDGFPDYSWPCTKGGKYEKSVKCMLSDDVTKLFGPSAPGMKKAVQCLLENVS
ncbi:hypothetical protein MTO96_005276 [Rhipicephalus appendiculatus]